MDNTATPLAILKARFGYDSFRALQEEIIGNVLGRRDSLDADAHRRRQVPLLPVAGPHL